MPGRDDGPVALLEEIPETVAEPAGDDAIGNQGMRVRKRNGDLEPVDVNKIVRAVERCAVSYTHLRAHET